MMMVKVGGIDDPVWAPPSRDVIDEGQPSYTTRVIVIALLVLIALGVVYPLAAAGLSRKDYGTFAFWKLPNRIDYCGRRYYDGGPEQGSPALFESLDSAKGAHWRFLSWTFSGRSIYADVAPLSSPSNTVCTMVLYIPLGGRSWETYELSGGP
jgi:hypothetical protein